MKPALIRARSRFLHPFPLFLVAILLLGTAAVFVAGWAIRVDGEHRVQRELEKLARMGFLTTREAVLADYYEVSWEPEENAAPELEAAFARIDTSREAWAEVGGFSGWSESDAEAARILLERNAEALELFHRASQRPYLRFPLDLESGTKFPHLEPMREGGRLLRLEASCRMQGDSPELAVESIRTLFRLALLMDREPGIWADISVRAIQNYGVSALAQLLDRTALDAEVLRDLRGLLAMLEEQPRLFAAWQGEIVTSEMEFQQFFADMPLFHALHARTGIYLREQAFYLSQIPDYLAASRDYARFEELEKKHEDAPIGYFTAGASFVTLKVSYSSLKLVEGDFVLRTRIRLLDAILAAELYRLERGRLPEEIAEWATEYEVNMRDPYTGEDFAVYSEGGYFVAKSAGLVGPSDDKRNIFLRIPVSRD